MTNPWDLIKQQLQLVLSAESFHNWFGRTYFSHIDRKTLHALVPDRQTLAWLENEYAEQVQARSPGSWASVLTGFSTISQRKRVISPRCCRYAVRSVGSESHSRRRDRNRI